MYLALQAGHLSAHKTIDGIGDAFMDTYSIDPSLSSNFFYDTARTGYGQTRSKFATVTSEEFNSLSGWTNTSTGTGVPSIISVVDPDPAVNGNSIRLTTGSTNGSIARVQRVVGSVPSSFGIGIMSRIGTTSIYGSDSLHIDIQSISNKQLSIRERYMAYEVFINGAWQLALAHPNHTQYMESWVEVTDQGDGTHRVQVLLGTQIVFDMAGILPSGTGTNGLLVVWQEGTAMNYRLSEVAYIHVGDTQKADNLMLTSNSVTAEYAPTVANLMLLVEDVSVSVNINTNVIGQVSNDNGATWQNVTMMRRGTFAPGEIDPPKNIDIFTGELALSGTGTAMRWRVITSGNNWNFMQGIHLGWE